MKKYNHKKCFLVIFFIFLIVVAIWKIPVFKIDYINDGNYARICNGEEIYVLKHEYVTGSGWCVLSGADENLINKNVLLCSKFDPRSLKDNKDFYLDYSSTLVVRVKKIGSAMLDGERVPMLITNDITVLSDKTKKKYYTVSDLTFEGIVRSILGFVNRKYWMSF